MKVQIIGLGLIGASFALAIREAFPKAEIWGTDTHADHLEKALQLGLIDKGVSLDAVAGAEVVVLSVPVNAMASLAEDVLDRCGPQTLVMDMGSTKGSLCERLSGHPRRAHFLAAHPIAGTEFSGPEAGVRGLFRNKTMVLCEAEATASPLLSRALDLFRRFEMRIRHMDPQAHDRHIAYVSHLSHISSFMLGKTVLDKEKSERDILDLAGSGFSSTVRLAKSSPAMWAPILEQNKTHVLESLKEYIGHLKHFQGLLEKEDFEGIFHEMESVQPIKRILSGIQ